MNTYSLIIVGSVLIIISYFFQVIGKKTNIPAVLMLMIFGMIIHAFAINVLGKEDSLNGLQNSLSVLGTVGLILIVLEASLDLKLSRKKVPIIIKSSVSAFVGTLLINFLVAYFIFVLFETTWVLSLLYAVPFAVMSSAIVIPSVASLKEETKEFLIYESSLSDILGIIFFYLFLDMNTKDGTPQAIIGQTSIKLLLTIVAGVIFSYIMIFIFSRIKEKTKLFLIIAALILLFSVGKVFHLSSLIIILIFGLILGNQNIFIRGRIAPLYDKTLLDEIYHGLHNITLESAFMIKTFFFFLFGLSISYASLLDFGGLQLGLGVIALTYAVRYGVLKLLSVKQLNLLTSVTPRGLISILLFFTIPTELRLEGFPESALLIIVIVTNLIMTFGLIRDKKRREKQLEETAKEVEEIVTEETASEEVLQSTEDRLPTVAIEEKNGEVDDKPDQQ